MSVSIHDAFGDRAWLFVTGYLLLQIGRAVFLIAALRGRPQGEHFVNDLVWELLAAVAVAYAGAWAMHWLPGRGVRVDRDTPMSPAAISSSGSGCSSSSCLVRPC